MQLIIRYHIIVVQIVWVPPSPRQSAFNLQGGNVFELAVIKLGIKAALV